MKSNLPDALTDREKAQLEFLWKQHSYIADFIRFADTKSGFIISLSSAYMAILLSPASWFRAFLPGRLFRIQTLTQATAATAVACLLLAVTCAAFTVFPRLQVGKEIGPISWIEIASFKSPEQFVHQSSSLQARTAVKLMAKQVYYMATICKRKNRLVQWSLTLAAIGAICSVSLLIVY